MSIVCTLEPKANLFKGPSTKNLFILKNSNNNGGGGGVNSHHNNNNNSNNNNSHSVNNNFNTPTITATPTPTSIAAAAAVVDAVIKNYTQNCGGINQQQNSNNTGGNSFIHGKEKNLTIKVNSNISDHNQNQQQQQQQQHFQYLQQHQQHHQQQQQQQDYKSPRISVADFVARQHSNTSTSSSASSSSSSLSPTASGIDLLNHHNRIVAAMPEVLSAATTTNKNSKVSAAVAAGVKTSAGTTAITGTAAPTIMNSAVRMSSISPSLSMNGSSNEATNVHGLSMYGGPVSPQSSDSGQSMADGMSSHGKYPPSSYDGHNGRSSQKHHGSGSSLKDLFTQRKQREFTPDNKKDDSYWDRRRRNNEAAKRSREKRRYNDMVLEQRVVELTKENHVLKAQLDAIKDKYNISGDNLVSVEQIMASLPTSEQVLSITKRSKMSTNNGFGSPSGPGSVPQSSLVYGGNSSSSNGNVSPITAQAISPAPLGSNQKSNGQSDRSDAPTPMSVDNGSDGSLCKAAPVIKSVNHGQQYMPSNGSLVHVSAGAPPHHLHNLATAAVVAAATQGPVPHYQPSSVDSYGDIASSAVNSHVIQHASGPNTTHLPAEARRSPHTGGNLNVLQAINPNVSCDDLDHLRKVVAVVGAAINTTNGSELAPLYSVPPTPGSVYMPHRSAAGVYGFGKEVGVDMGPNYSPPAEVSVSSSAADAVTSSSSSAGGGVASVLNLSRRAAVSSPPYDHALSSTTLSTSSSSRLSSSLSSASSSGAVSGDDEHDQDMPDDVDAQPLHPLHHHHHHHNHLHNHHHPNMVNVSPSGPSGNSDGNNCLPLKLRHKSHLGDKDAAATALLSLQHIKQEPISSRASPPSGAWNDGGDNSSDERDSGISIASAEWTAQFHRKVMTPTGLGAGVAVEATTGVVVTPSEREHILQSKLARLESEVASIKNLMIQTTGDQGGVSPELKV